MSRRCSQHFQVISFHWEVGGPLGLSSIIFPNQPGALAGISTLSCIIPSTVHCRVQYGLYTQPSFLPPPFPYFHLRCWCITFLFLPPPSSCFPIFWMTNSVGSISRFANIPQVNPPPVRSFESFGHFWYFLGEVRQRQCQHKTGDTMFLTCPLKFILWSVGKEGWLTSKNHPLSRGYTHTQEGGRTWCDDNRVARCRIKMLILQESGEKSIA